MFSSIGQLHTFRSATPLRKSEMDHFCHFHSFLLCCRRLCTWLCFAHTHAGNELMVCEHCVANVIRSKDRAFTLNDSHILRIFISDSGLPLLGLGRSSVVFSRVAIRVFCHITNDAAAPMPISNCALNACDAMQCTPSLVPRRKTTERIHCVCVRLAFLIHSQHNQLHKYSD